MKETEFSSNLVQEYLSDAEVAVLATVNPDGSPLAIPMWFVHDNEFVVMVSQANDMKVRNMRRDPRVCFVVESGSGSNIACLIVQGRVTFVMSEADRDREGARFIDKYGIEMEERWEGHAVPESRALFLMRPYRIKVWGALERSD